METLILECPHCHDFISIEKKDINCAIFRHAVYKMNYQPIPPHSSQTECESLIDQGLVYGCAKPFKLIIEKQKFCAEKCDYI